MCPPGRGFCGEGHLQGLPLFTIQSEEEKRSAVLANRAFVCHSKSVSLKSLAVLLLRFAGLLLFLGGLVILAADVLASWGKVGLVYWRTFLMTVVIPPILGALLGLVLLLLSKPLGSFLAKGLEASAGSPGVLPGASSPKAHFRTGDRASRKESGTGE